MLSELSYKEMEYLVEEYIHNGRNRDIILRKLHNECVTKCVTKKQEMP